MFEKLQGLEVPFLSHINMTRDLKKVFPHTSNSFNLADHKSFFKRHRLEIFFLHLSTMLIHIVINHCSVWGIHRGDALLKEYQQEFIIMI